MARVLAESFQKHNAGVPFFVLLLDEVDGFFQPEEEQFELLQTRCLKIPNVEGFLFKYDVLEASTAVKPYFLEFLFQEYKFKKLVYLDPDILVLGPLSRIGELLESYSLVLIPHLTTPFPDDQKPSDDDILRAGVFNLGFLAMRNDEAAQKLLGWWQRKVYHNCLVAFEMGMFVDQKWMDFVPAFFKSTAILREPGYNVAYWNLHERTVTRLGDAFLVNGEPCYFFHFSGFNPDQPSIISKHQTRFTMNQIGDCAQLFAQYRTMVLSKGWEQTKRWPYSYNLFANGITIPKSARRFYWSLGPQVEDLGNPFTWLDQTTPEHTPAKRAQSPRVTLPGVNLVGYVTSEKGVGEASRSNLRILQAANVPHTVNNFIDPGSSNLEPLPANLTNSNPYRVNLINVNADQTPHFAHQNEGYLAGHYNIGYWAWELSRFPDEWKGSFDYLDEVWVPSTFVRESVGRASPLPVTCVPHSIDPDITVDPEWTRENLGFSKDLFVFLFLFDFHSYLARKNPEGLMRAFKRAFGDRQDVLLLLKSSRRDFNPAGFHALEILSEGANVRFFDEVMSRRAVHSLISACDCYVSLHRSEGFGLTLSEAMSCAKPVIATGYSGNMDFMSERNSFPVRYRMIEIDDDHGPYKRGQMWAAPDIDHAAELMDHVVNHRADALAIAEQGKRDVLAQLHPKTIGRLVRQRLGEINGAAEGSDSQSKMETTA